jgi:ATP adenylyltransferase
MEYIESTGKDARCIFCEVQAMTDGVENLIVFRGQFAYVILNLYPYTSGHLMIVPYEHRPNLDDLDTPTRGDMIELTARSMTVLRKLYRPQAFNLGANIGEAAGAGVKEHVHFHVVPRWTGDTNFMSALAQTRVLPETLDETYRRVRAGFQN